MEIQTIVNFLQTISPLSVIALLALIIYALIKNDLSLNIFKNKDKINNNESLYTQEVPVTLGTISLQLEKIAGNHLHDLPGIREDVTKILNIQDKMIKELNDQGQRMVRVETLLGIGVPDKK